MIAESRTRVHDQAAGDVTARIRRQSRADVAYYAAHPDRIDERLRELDWEWDVERWLQANSATLSLVGIALGMVGRRGWLLLPAAVQSFFLQHGLQGWCPPLPVFRRLGIRTAGEIEAERHALELVRGDGAGMRRHGDGHVAPTKALTDEALAVSSTTHRVPRNTRPEVNADIRSAAERRIAFYAAHPELVEERLEDLDHEWDIERVIEIEAPMMTLTGLTLGLTRSRRWLLLPLLVQAMMLLHARQGFYPLLPLFRRMGLRTDQEIHAERFALKAARGVVQSPDVPGSDPRELADQAFEAALA